MSKVDIGKLVAGENIAIEYRAGSSISYRRIVKAVVSRVTKTQVEIKVGENTFFKYNRQTGRELGLSKWDLGHVLRTIPEYEDNRAAMLKGQTKQIIRDELKKLSDGVIYDDVTVQALEDIIRKIKKYK